MDDTASRDLVSELQVPRRFEIAKTWALAARDVAELTKHPIALKLWDFIDNRTTIAAPMPEGGIHYFFPKKPTHPYGFYAYLTPILEEDLDRLPSDDPRASLAAGHSSHVVEYRENSQAIYLPSSSYGRLGKGVLLLHEAFHAWLDIKKMINREIPNSHWIEEAKVFRFEFELLDKLIGSGYHRICNNMSKSIKPLKHDPQNITLTYRPQIQDETLIKQKMQATSDQEINLWLSVCKLHAYWLYYQENSNSADIELALHIKSRQLLSK